MTKYTVDTYKQTSNTIILASRKEFTSAEKAYAYAEKMNKKAGKYVHLSVENC